MLWRQCNGKSVAALRVGAGERWEVGRRSGDVNRRRVACVRRSWRVRRVWVCVLGMSVVTVLRVDFLLCSSLSRLRSVPNVPNQSNPTVTRTPMRHSRLHRAQAASRPRSFTTTIRVFWKQLHEILEAEEQSRRFESLKVYDELLDQKLVKKRHERAVDVREFESDTSTIPGCATVDVTSGYAWL